ncbi:hypothetical protein L3X38_007639 [Prunus dulcis]|uniref:Uncharacterized protein n=1 Tax=Prunus dulcis TaxID=3755 RepID=A0AAD4ZV30_PRUDU|nr:hypothetical protein L3X38_007639 [Prunus dulcis]
MNESLKETLVVLKGHLERCIYIEGSLLDPIHTTQLNRNSPIRVIAIRIGFSGEELLYLALQICSSIIQSAPAPCQTQVSVKHVMALKNLHFLDRRVTEVADSLLLQDGTSDSIVIPRKIEECLSSIFGIGIACSAESLADRKDIGDVASELHFIRDKLLV